MSMFNYQMKQGDIVVAKGVATPIMLVHFQEAFVKMIDPIIFDPSGHEPAFSEVITMKVGEYRSWKAVSSDFKEYSFSCECVEKIEDSEKTVIPKSFQSNEQN